MDFSHFTFTRNFSKPTFHWLGQWLYDNISLKKQRHFSPFWQLVYMKTHVKKETYESGHMWRPCQKCMCKQQNKYSDENGAFLSDEIESCELNMWSQNTPKQTRKDISMLERFPIITVIVKRRSKTTTCIWHGHMIVFSIILFAYHPICM